MTIIRAQISIIGEGVVFTVMKFFLSNDFQAGLD